MIEWLLAATCVVLAAASPVALAIAFDEALQGDAKERKPDPRGWWVIASIAAVLRWFVVPHRIATVWIGYRWTQQVRDLLPLPHYGAGSAAVYWLALSVLPPDHLSLMWVNAVLGVALVLFVAALSHRLSGSVAALVAASLVAAVPLFVRNDTSDANNVPALLALLGGLVAWVGFLDRGRRGTLVSALLLATLASLSRPELVVLVPVSFVAVTWVVSSSGEAWTKLRADRRVWVGVGAWVGGAALQVAHVVAAAGELKARSSLPGLSVERLSELPQLARNLNVLIDPRLFPVVLSVVALVALFLKPTRRLAVALWTIALLSLLAVVVDLDWANVARVQVPAAILVCILSGAVAGTVVTRWPGARGWAVVGAVSAVVLVGMVGSSRLLWAPTNEEAEEQLIQRAVKALPATPVTFARWDRPDRDEVRDPQAITHHHFPNYWFQPPFRNDRLAGLAEVASKPIVGPTYLLLSYRCYAMFRRVDDPAPSGDDLQPTCRKVLDELKLEPVFEEDAPNHGNVWLNYFGTAKTLKIGLYRVLGRKSDVASP